MNQKWTREIKQKREMKMNQKSPRSMPEGFGRTAGFNNGASGDERRRTSETEAVH